MNKNPDQITAEKIIDRLVQNRFLSEEKKEEWLKKLSSGTASAEDWNLLADFYIKEKEQADDSR